MRVVVDTGVFSASISRRRRQRFKTQIALMAGNQLFLAATTVSELRYGALVAGWSEARRERLEESIQATTVVPVSNKLPPQLPSCDSPAAASVIRSTIGVTPTTFGSQPRQSTSGHRSSLETASLKTLPG